MLATDLHRPQKKLPALGAEDLEAVRQDLDNGERGGGSGDTKGIATSIKEHSQNKNCIKQSRVSRRTTKEQ